MVRFSGFDDAYNIIEGLRHGGSAQAMRRRLTDFGSGWNALRGLVRANETFAQMTGGKGFKQALSSAREGRTLGSGMFGEAREMISTFRGQEFRFARKTGEIGEHEVAAMRRAQGTVTPDIYTAKKGQIDMELFSGTTLQDMPATQLEGLQGKVKSAFAKMHATGFEHGDPHLGNVMLTKEGRIGLIDLGRAKKLAGPRAAEAAAGDISVSSKLIKARISGTSQLAAIDPFASAWGSVSTALSGNKTEFMFQAAKNGGRRHKNMGYN